MSLRCPHVKTLNSIAVGKDPTHNQTMRTTRRLKQLETNTHPMTNEILKEETVLEIVDPEKEVEEMEQEEIPRARRRTRRSKDEIQKDVILYNELLEKNKNLEKDIPPRRANIKKEEVEVEFHRLRRRKQPSPDVPQSRSVLKRPKFIINNPSTPYKPKHDKTSPPKMSQLTTNNYQHQVLLENSYEDLINLVNSNINVKDPQESNIDISWHYQLIAKNLRHQDERFQIETNADVNDLLKYKSFNRDEIDLFFRNFNKLNGGQDVNETRNVPLV